MTKELVKNTIEKFEKSISNEKVTKELAKVLPKHLTPERMVRIALTEFKQNPKLQQCSTSSILSALMKCSEIGLEPSSALGHAYLVPYLSKDNGMQCQLIVGYKGYMHLARKSGQIKNIVARIVRKHDHFEWSYGFNENLVHVPEYRKNEYEEKQSEGNQLLYVYAIAKLDDGISQFDVMTMDEIKTIKAKSTSKTGPWVTDFEEMAKKTVVRRLCKYLPLSNELDLAVNLDSSTENGYVYDAEKVEKHNPEQELINHLTKPGE
jgi:recombination protein RecT